MPRKPKKPIEVKTLTHGEAKRTNIPTAEFESVMRDEEKSPIRLAYERRNRDLDPQLVWRGKDEQDWSDLVVHAPPLYIQEKVHPKVLIDDLLRESKARADQTPSETPDLFADFNGLPDKEAATEFYAHDANWSNRMILGDSLQVMASLAEREGLRGRVQCIYLDPPYGIKFNSNFQWSTTSRDVKDGKAEHISREPEQVKAFRDTWRDGIHSYLTYLRDRLTVARDLLADSGSIFVQIGDENVHLVRGLMDEVFGTENFCAIVSFSKTSGLGSKLLPSRFDFLIWYARSAECVKFRQPYLPKSIEEGTAETYNWIELSDGNRRGLTAEEKRNNRLIPTDGKLYRPSDLTSQGNPRFPFKFMGKEYSATWKTTNIGLTRLGKANRLHVAKNSLRYLRTLNDFPVMPTSNYWEDTGTGSFTDDKLYVVQTGVKTIQRCLLMTTDPGDLVLDPTCGSGTTAYVAEQWGRRWITIDTSRVALALARARIMGARYPYYLLADSPEGQRKEAEITRKAPSEAPTRGDIRQGFVYERVPHITLKSIANNAEIDVIWEKWQEVLEPLRAALNAAVLSSSPLSSSPSMGEDRGGGALGASGGNGSARTESASTSLTPTSALPHRGGGGEGSEGGGPPWEEWEIPREAGDPWPEKAAKLHASLSAIKAELARDLAAVQSVGQPERIAELRRKRSREAKAELDELNALLGRSYALEDLPDRPLDPWSEEATRLHAEWWEARIARQKEIDASIAAKAEFEYLYDKPYADKSRIRVAGPFTVESLSPHRVLAVDQDDELVDGLDAAEGRRAAPERSGDEADFAQVILENLKTSGIQQAHKEDKIDFTAITGWPGRFICAEGRYVEGARERRAGIFIGPEFGTVSRPDLVAAAREAGDAGFDVLVACAFNFDAHSAEFDKLGRVPVLKARMNADLHMADDLKNTGKGNLFVIFGEPDIEIRDAGDDKIQVKINGVDVFHPQTGEIESSGADGIACWFIDTDYNEESFFVRHAYFLGAGDPYKALKTTLKAEIDRDAWESLHSDTSRPFDKPKSGRIAVKVINHLGDEVMKVFSVG